MTSIRFVFGRLQHSVLNFLRHDLGSALFLFLVALVLRAIPEILIPSYPVGYETITWYAPAIMTFLGRSVGNVFFGFFRNGPLFYVSMWFLANITGASAFTLLKVVGPLLYGGLVTSFFVFLKRGLKFDWKMAFVATFLLAFQIAALRESWDRFRTVLGLVFLFAALTAFKSDDRHKWGLLAVFGSVTALSREYVALVLFVSVSGFVLIEKRSDKVRSLLALAPAFVVFSAMVFPALSESWTGLVETEFALRGYVWVVQDAFVIFAVCYLAILPFVLLGWRLRRDWLIASMSVWLLVASFSVVFGPLLSVPGYQRWLMLLAFPLCVYAAWGFEHLHLFSGRRVWVLVSVLLVFMIIGSGYASGAFSYVGVSPNSYVAVSLVGSSIRWDQVDDVKAVLSWLDQNAVVGSSVLVEECFYGWTMIYLERADSDVRVIPYGAASSPMSALETALCDGFNPVYLIWFSGQSVQGFRVVYSWDAVSVFEHVS